MNCSDQRQHRPAALLDLAFYQTDTIGPQDADLLIQLKPSHKPTAEYQRKIRDLPLAQVSKRHHLFSGRRHRQQVLNFGLPAAIDAQINGNDLQADYDIALRLKDKMSLIPGRQRSPDCRAAGLSDLPGQRRSRQGAATRHHAAAGRLEHALDAVPAPRCCSPTSGSIQNPASTTALSRSRRSI